MISGQFFVAMACVAVLSQADADGPIVIGDQADLLTVGDIQDISSLVGPEGPPWMIDVDTLGPPTKPPNLIVRAYLVPYLKTEAIRRGRTMWLHQEVSDAREVGYVWHLGKQPTEWAQVALPGHKFSNKLTKPGKLDAFIVVAGEISDVDLIDLVQYIRSGPSVSSAQGENPDGSALFEGGPKVEATYPVISVIPEGDCYFEINTEQRPGAGQRIEVIRSDGGWQVIGVSEWVV